MIPKVLVGCPTSDHKSYCIDKYVEAVKSLTYKNYDILIVDNSKENSYSERIKELGLNVIKSVHHEGARDRIIESRNILRKETLDKGYDYFLSLEQDVIPQKDVIERLIRHSEMVVSGLYFAVNLVKGKNVLRPLLWANFDPKTRLMYCLNKEYALNSNDFVEICACGLGCVLIHREILEDIKFRYESETDGFDDMFFCRDVRGKNIKIFADLSVKCRHLTTNWSWKNIKR